MPDLTFLKENQQFVRALILTHGHEDHIGAVPFFLSEIDVPVYGTAFHAGAGRPPAGRVRPRTRSPSSSRSSRSRSSKIGPFKIEFIHVTHSIVSAVALAITTPLGVIIHTGDFKVDPTPTDNELVRSAHAGRLRQARRAAAAFRFHQLRPARLHASPNAPCGRAWKRFSTARRAGWWSPVSARRSTAFS